MKRKCKRFKRTRAGRRCASYGAKEKLHWTAMGWNDATMLELYSRFLEKYDLDKELNAFLQAIADEEQEEEEQW